MRLVPNLFLASLMLLAFVSTGASGCSGGAKSDGRKKPAPSKEIIEVGDISGPVIINGRFQEVGPLEGKTLKLYETEGKDRFLIDSTTISNGSYRFELSEAKIGIYRLGVSNLESAIGEIILNPQEAEIDIDYRTPNFMNSMTYKNSKENTAYQYLKAAKRKYAANLKKIQRSQIPRNEKLNKIYALDASLDRAQDSLASVYEGTFFAKMARRMQSPQRFNKASYWNDIDFSDGSLIRSQVLNDRIQDYMRIHASKENTKEDNRKGFYNAVDRISQLAQKGGNDRVLEYMLYTVSEGFYSSGMEDVSHYVIDNYFYGDACGDSEISELFKNKAAGIRKLEVGNTPPVFSLPAPDGAMIKSLDVVSKNEYTLIMFWASFCHKCEAEIPQVNAVYREYSQKGFEVISISVDTDKRSWQKGINEKDPPGFNVSDVLGWAGKTTKDYRVSSTPVMFLIDKSGILVQKPKSAGQLKSFLSSKL